MLYTNLKHLENASDYSKAINENEFVTVICGRMEASCIPAYRIAEELNEIYPHVCFYDMEYDHPESVIIRTLPEVHDFTSIPYVIYYKNGRVVNATSGLQTREKIIHILDKEFTPSINA